MGAAPRPLAPAPIHDRRIRDWTQASHDRHECNSRSFEPTYHHADHKAVAKLWHCLTLTRFRFAAFGRGSPDDRRRLMKDWSRCHPAHPSVQLPNPRGLCAFGWRTPRDGYVLGGSCGSRPGLAGSDGRSSGARSSSSSAEVISTSVRAAWIHDPTREHRVSRATPP